MEIPKIVYLSMLRDNLLCRLHFKLEICFVSEIVAGRRTKATTPIGPEPTV